MAFARGAQTQSLKGRALRYLSQREHSRAELLRKLTPHAQDTAQATAREQIDAALDELAAKGLLSDARTAASVLRSQGPRHGSLRLKQTLQAKGLASELVIATLAEAGHDEFERAWALWQRRFGSRGAGQVEQPLDAAERARQMRFLAGRGFTGAIISRVFKAASRLPLAPDPASDDDNDDNDDNDSAL